MVGCRAGMGNAVRDREAYQECTRRRGPVMGWFTARIRKADGQFEACMSGRGSSAIMGFPAFEQTGTCCRVEKNQVSLPFARKVYDRDLAIVEGT